MKKSRQPITRRRGVTLLEMTIVIMVLLALIGTGMFSYGKMDEWKLGRAASETLRQVHTAQRMFLADHPTADVTKLTDAMLIPYLPNIQITPLPTTLVAALKTSTTAKPISGGNLSFNITVSPPHFLQGGSRYDPSGSYTDSLWDVGE